MRETHTDVGRIEAIFLYPVKSMAGQQPQKAHLGWHGIAGDRRLAFRRTQERSGFPWLSASKLPDLLLFSPSPREEDSPDLLPTHVRTPQGLDLPMFGEDLAGEIERRHGAPVQMMHLRAGIFDEATVSVIAMDTVREIAEHAGATPDIRRFRPNIAVRLHRPGAFHEDAWLGGVLAFGDPDGGACVSVTMRDERCSMINLDPDSGQSNPEMLRTVVRMNRGNAGVYGTVVRTGELAPGQTVYFRGNGKGDAPQLNLVEAR